MNILYNLNGGFANKKLQKTGEKAGFDTFLLNPSRIQLNIVIED